MACMQSSGIKPQGLGPKARVNLSIIASNIVVHYVLLHILEYMHRLEQYDVINVIDMSQRYVIDMLYSHVIAIRHRYVTKTGHKDMSYSHFIDMSHRHYVIGIDTMSMSLVQC